MVNGQAGESLSSFMMYIRILCVIFDFLSQIEMYMFFCLFLGDYLYAQIRTFARSLCFFEQNDPSS